MSDAIVSDQPRTGEPIQTATARRRESWFARGYRVFAYAGLMSVFAGMLLGFRHDPAAAAVNYLFDVALYVLFVVPHLLLTRSWIKRALWGDPAGSLAERQFYISLAILSWVAVLALARPLPGPSLALPWFVTLVGYVAALWSLLLFFQGATREGLDGLVGVPGSLARYSHGPQTPLFTEGPYAEVRHPMYRAAILAGLSTMVIHPNAAQLLWCAMIGATFILFIPVEEAQLLAARGEDYRRYCEQTPYRLFRHVW